jgi:hypothetical protein
MHESTLKCVEKLTKAAALGDWRLMMAISGEHLGAYVRTGPTVKDSCTGLASTPSMRREDKLAELAILGWTLPWEHRLLMHDDFKDLYIEWVYTHR